MAALSAEHIIPTGSALGCHLDVRIFKLPLCRLLVVDVGGMHIVFNHLSLLFSKRRIPCTVSHRPRVGRTPGGISSGLARRGYASPCEARGQPWAAPPRSRCFRCLRWPLAALPAALRLVLEPGHVPEPDRVAGAGGTGSRDSG